MLKTVLSFLRYFSPIFFGPLFVFSISGIAEEVVSKNASPPQISESPPENQDGTAVRTAQPGQRSVRKRSANSPESIKIKRFKLAARKKLLRKLTNKDGKPSKIYVLEPINYTNLEETDTVIDTIVRGITSYDPKLRVNEGSFGLNAITLEQFRRAIAHYDADILITTVIYPTNIDLYLYDRRTPFQIYAHTEPIATPAQYDFTKEAANYYTKLLVRRTLYRFIKEQFYELPRDNSAPVLEAEIPRFIASQESLDMVNRELISRFYGTVNLGAALSVGKGSKLWNSNLIALQLAFRPFGRFYLEGALELFAYNSVVGSMKYVFSDRDASYKLSLGLGYAMTTTHQSINWDQTDGITNGTKFVVPSISILFPIVDVYLKAETQVFVGITSRRYIFTILPGIMMMF